MQLLDVAFHVVHDYPGGSKSLAPRLNKSQHTLNHEVAGDGSAKLGIVDACKITQLTKDMRILHAFAEACGHLCIPMPGAVAIQNGNVMQALAESSREFAELCQEVCGVMADDDVSDNDLARVEKARGELVAQLAVLGEVLLILNQQGKPAHAKGGQ